MPPWVEYILRVLLAVGLGSVMGVERQLRLKLGGIRTHAIVAAGACLFMLISKYGFTDSSNYDASRIASQVVSGISFIGAGMIMHRQAVHGLTSAAGIWLTAAIGMAAGAGMYIVAPLATLIIVIVQLIFHIPIPIFKEKHYNEINIVFVKPDDLCQSAIMELFSIKKFTEFKAERKEDKIIYSATLHTKIPVDEAFVGQALENYPYILSIHQIESDR